MAIRAAGTRRSALRRHSTVFKGIDTSDPFLFCICFSYLCSRSSVCSSDLDSFRYWSLMRSCFSRSCWMVRAKKSRSAAKGGGRGVREWKSKTKGIRA